MIRAPPPQSQWPHSHVNRLDCEGDLQPKRIKHDVDSVEPLPQEAIRVFFHRNPPSANDTSTIKKQTRRLIRRNHPNSAMKKFPVDRLFLRDGRVRAIRHGCNDRDPLCQWLINKSALIPRRHFSSFPSVRHHVFHLATSFESSFSVCPGLEIYHTFRHHPKPFSRPMQHET
jgi:hypothetical protein